MCSYLQQPYFLNQMYVITLTLCSNVCSYPTLRPHSAVYNIKAKLPGLGRFPSERPDYIILTFLCPLDTDCVKNCLAVSDSLCSFGVMYVVNVEQQSIPTAGIYLIIIVF